MVNNLLGSRISVRGPVRQLWDGTLSIPLIPIDGSKFREQSSTTVYTISGGQKVAVLEPSGRRPAGRIPRVQSNVHVVWDGARWHRSPDHASHTDRQEAASESSSTECCVATGSAERSPIVGGADPLRVGVVADAHRSAIYGQGRAWFAQGR